MSLADGLELDNVAIIVPVFNESSVLADVIGDIRRFFPCVICVDDGSSDNSSEIAVQEGAVVLRHPVNLGQGAALRTGIDWALTQTQARWLVTFDADGQHRPDDAVRMVRRAVVEQVDVVLGARSTRNSEGIRRSRRVLLKLALLFTRATTGLHVSDTHNGLRVMSRTGAQLMRLQQHGMAHASEMLALISQHGLRYVEEPVSITYDEYSIAKGQSNLNAVNILHDLFAARLRAAR